MLSSRSACSAIRCLERSPDLRLLLIEDEARIVELLSAAFSAANFAVDAVTTYAEAHAAFLAAPYDAAILDLSLPDGDGLALLTEVRARGNRLPILILTARD